MSIKRVQLAIQLDWGISQPFTLATSVSLAGALHPHENGGIQHVRSRTLPGVILFNVGNHQLNRMSMSQEVGVSLVSQTRLQPGEARGTVTISSPCVQEKFWLCEVAACWFLLRIRIIDRNRTLFLHFSYVKGIAWNVRFHGKVI